MCVKVSVVIPTYNRAATVGRAINSALAQHVPDLEVVVVDDGSTDSTSQVLSQYGSQVSVLHQPNQGVARARTNGVLAAKGEFVAFLDSDDEWYPHKLARQLSLLEQHPSAGLVSSGAEFVEPGGRIRSRVSQTAAGNLVGWLMYRNCIVTSSVLVRRECLLSVQPMFRAENWAGEDWDLWLRLAARWPFVVSPEVLVRYHLTPGSLDRKKSAEAYGRLYESIYTAMTQDAALGPVLKQNWRSVQANICLMTAVKHHEAGNPWRARWELLRALARSPRPVQWTTAASILFLSPAWKNRVKAFVANRSRSRHAPGDEPLDAAVRCGTGASDAARDGSMDRRCFSGFPPSRE
jgi:glycosyltransferase involved in cell wall biosynthesis